MYKWAQKFVYMLIIVTVWPQLPNNYYSLSLRVNFKWPPPRVTIVNLPLKVWKYQFTLKFNYLSISFNNQKDKLYLHLFVTINWLKNIKPLYFIFLIWVVIFSPSNYYTHFTSKKLYKNFRIIFLFQWRRKFE